MLKKLNRITRFNLGHSISITAAFKRYSTLPLNPYANPHRALNKTPAQDPGSLPILSCELLQPCPECHCFALCPPHCVPTPHQPWQHNTRDNSVAPSFSGFHLQMLLHN
ncbi:hypothetical protein SLE2022_157250 [Rubroshorea leprosula]